MKEERLLIRIDKQTKAKLAKLAKESNRSMSDYVRLIIEESISSKKKV